jgi:hypothetical protein
VVFQPNKWYVGFYVCSIQPMAMKWIETLEHICYN